MIRFPNAKINLGLNITERRPDGYHNIETLFYPVDWCDTLEIIDTDAQKTRLFSSGLAIVGETSDNLILKAYSALSKDFNLPPVDIHLIKNIPMGAGLGGGSADAAFMLQMLNDKMDLGLDMEHLSKYAAKIGADCPFFLHNHPTLAFGIGDQFKPCDINLSDYHIVIIKPDIHSDTAAAYRSCKPCKWDIPLEEAVKQPILQWRQYVHNDFETPIFIQHPPLGHLKTMLYHHGAAYASMSGSGSSIYGLFSGRCPYSEIMSDTKKILQNIGYKSLCKPML